MPISRSRRWSSCRRKVAEIIRADQAVDYINSTVGAGGPNPTTNYGRMFIALKPRAERGESATAVIQRLRRHRQRGPGHDRSIFQAVQNINIDGPHLQERIPVHAAIERHRGALPRRARDARQDRQDRRPARRQQRSLHQEPADGRRDRPREGGGLRRHRSIRSARSCSTPSAPARSRRSTRRPTTTRSSWRASRNSRPTSRRCRRSIVKTTAAASAAGSVPGGG